MTGTIIDSMKHIAETFIAEHYPDFDSVAVARLDNGEYVTSTELFNVQFNNCLCPEVGTMFEATNRQQSITHLLCMDKYDEESEAEISIPCGTCLERLLHWGDGVEIAVATDDGGADFFTIKDLFPANWLTLTKDEE